MPFTRLDGKLFVSAMLCGLGLLVFPILGDESEDETPPQEIELLPSRYFLCQRDATEFCQPIRTAFDDASTTATGHMLRGRVAVQHLNGGYGVRMDLGGGRMLLHCGADLGWFDVGEPVFAVADGVVRGSHPGIRVLLAEQGIKKTIHGPADYGNCIVIEHRIGGESFCTLYGHLGDDRLVRRGDVVSAGQQIGTIGRKSGIVNGDYEPHLHFAIHEGAYVSPGTPLMNFEFNGERAALAIEHLTETELTLRCPIDLPNMQIGFGPEQRYRLGRTEDGYTLPGCFAWMASSAGARIPGYSDRLDGFRDPIAFLKEQLVAGRPAALYPVSSYRDLEFPNRVGQPAAPWTATDWLNTRERPGPTLESVRGKVCCLFLFQVLCPGTKSHGWSTLQAVARDFELDPQVQLIALQTPFAVASRNNAANLKRAVSAAGVTIPVGQISDAAGFASAYGQRGTPWVVLIDRDGTIQFSNFLVRPEEIVSRIGELRGQPAAADAAP